MKALLLTRMIMRSSPSGMALKPAGKNAQAAPHRQAITDERVPRWRSARLKRDSGDVVSTT
jgi:hypothetical protein